MDTGHVQTTISSEKLRPGRRPDYVAVSGIVVGRVVKWSGLSGRWLIMDVSAEILSSYGLAGHRDQVGDDDQCGEVALASALSGGGLIVRRLAGAWQRFIGRLPPSRVPLVCYSMPAGPP